MSEAIEPVTLQSGQVIATVGAVTAITTTTNFPGANSLSTAFLFRDATVTAQVAAPAAAPGAGATVATVTPGVAGLWEVYGLIGITGTTVVAADTNNMKLSQAAVVKLAAMTISVTGLTGAPAPVPFGPVLLNLGAADAVTVAAVGAATAASVYAATIICRRVG